jgi:hypothetical protein
MQTIEREIEATLFKGGRATTNIRIPDCLGILENPADKAPQWFGTFRIMTPKDGDKRVVWDSRDFTQIREAKEMFDQLVAQGLIPYRVGINGQRTSEVMVEFDPYAEEIIFLPMAMVAGG